MPIWRRKTSNEKPAQLPVSKEKQGPVSLTVEQPVSPPKREPNRRRDQILKMRVSLDEKDYIKKRAKAAGMSVVDFVLATSRATLIIVIDDLPELIRQLRQMGTNLNQLVRLAHATGNEENPELKEAIQQCIATQKEVIGFCKKWDIKIRKASANKENGHGNHHH